MVLMQAHEGDKTTPFYVAECLEAAKNGFIDVQWYGSTDGPFGVYRAGKRDRRDVGEIMWDPFDLTDGGLLPQELEDDLRLQFSKHPAIAAVAEADAMEL